jgi:hypothetical protein
VYNVADRVDDEDEHVAQPEPTRIVALEVVDAETDGGSEPPAPRSAPIPDMKPTSNFVHSPDRRAVSRPRMAEPAHGGQRG